MTEPDDAPALKDETRARPIAAAWRPTLAEVVRRLARKDYALAEEVWDVAPLDPATAKQISEYVDDYGETLTELPAETWSSSVAQWMGTHWDVLVDLWTEESGPSDMVMSARVFEAGDGFRFEIHLVYVP